MTDADLFREYAKEAIRESSKAKSESKMLAFNELALTWRKPRSQVSGRLGQALIGRRPILVKPAR